MREVVSSGCAEGNSAGRSRGFQMPVSRIPCVLPDGNNTDTPIFASTARNWPHRHSDRVTTALLHVAYVADDAMGEKPPLCDDVLTMCPSTPCSSMVGTNALMPLMTPLSLIHISEPTRL